MSFHLAQTESGASAASLADPRIQEFVDGLSPSMHWPNAPRLRLAVKIRTPGNATDVHHPWSEDPFILVNMSVWKRPEDLKQYVYRSGHMEYFQKRAGWFEKPTKPHYVLWWVPQGHIPGLEEARDRLNITGAMVRRRTLSGSVRCFRRRRSRSWRREPADSRLRAGLPPDSGY